MLEQRPSRGWLVSFISGTTAVVSAEAADVADIPMAHATSVIPPNVVAWVALIAAVFAGLSALFTALIQLRTLIRYLMHDMGIKKIKPNVPVVPPEPPPDPPS